MTETLLGGKIRLKKNCDFRRDGGLSSQNRNATRYLDPKYSRWMSADPAVGDYMSQTEKGEGGIYNLANLNVYHYGGNNPLRYTDPTGRQSAKPDWNGELKDKTNCYSYALNQTQHPNIDNNDVAAFGLQPGELSNIEQNDVFANPDSFLNAIEQDCKELNFSFEEKVSPADSTDSGNWMIAVIYWCDDEGKVADFHVYKRDENGDWSSKQPKQPVSSLPSNDPTDGSEYPRDMCDVKLFEIGPNRNQEE